MMVRPWWVLALQNAKKLISFCSDGKVLSVSLIMSIATKNELAAYCENMAGECYSQFH